MSLKFALIVTRHGFRSLRLPLLTFDDLGEDSKTFLTATYTMGGRDHANAKKEASRVLAWLWDVAVVPGTLTLWLHNLLIGCSPWTTELVL